MSVSKGGRDRKKKMVWQCSRDWAELIRGRDMGSSVGGHDLELGVAT